MITKTPRPLWAGFVSYQTNKGNQTMTATATKPADQILLCATPYNIDAPFFYFSTLEEYESRVAKLTDRYGQPVEEFMIDFIDGSRLDSELAQATKLDQCNFVKFLEAVDEWENHEKTIAIIAMGEDSSLSLDDDPHLRDVSIYDAQDLTDLAEQFVDDGLFGEIPDRLIHYIDYEAIGRDLRFDYHETTVAGENFFYRMD